MLADTHLSLYIIFIIIIFNSETLFLKFMQRATQKINIFINAKFFSRWYYNVTFNITRVAFEKLRANHESQNRHVNPGDILVLSLLGIHRYK